MKINIRIFLLLLLTILLGSSFYYSTQFTDSFIIPKVYFYLFSLSGFLFYWAIEAYFIKYKTASAYSLLDVGIVLFFLLYIIRFVFSTGLMQFNTEFLCFTGGLFLYLGIRDIL